MTSILDSLLDSPVYSLGNPMLAGRIEEKDFKKLRFPFLGSMKIDGYRGIYQDGVFYSRIGKPHQAAAIKALGKEMKENNLPDGIEGEFIIPGESFNSAGGKLRRRDYSGPLEFHVFDIILPDFSAQDRFTFLKGLQGNFPSRVRLLKQTWLSSLEEMLAFENDCLAFGGEGIVLRAPRALYKHGRGTLNDQIMLKLKRFATAEAEILSVEPRMHNLNEKKENPLGYAERSSNKENLIETGILGKMNVRGINGDFKGIEFSIGNFEGLDDMQKGMYLEEAPIGEIVTYKYFPTGVKDKPRHPVFIGFRPDWDLEREEKERKENGIEKR